MYSEVTDEFIIKTLMNYEERTRILNAQMKNAFCNLAKNTQEIMESVSYPIQEMDFFRFQKNDWSDLIKTYESFKRLSKDQARDLNFLMRNIVEEQESMNRVMAAYEALEDMPKSLLKMYYIENPTSKKKVAIKRFGEEHSLSERSIYRIRTAALKRIKEIYNSDLTQSEIYRLQLADTDSDSGNKITYR